MLKTSARRRLAVSLAGLAGVLALPASVRAESRKHDELYLSANAGVGYVTRSGSSLSGVSTPFALWGGYTFGIVAVGGGVFTDCVWSPSYKPYRDEPSRPVDGFALFGFAAFADVYLDPKGGLHVMPSIGRGGLTSTSSAKDGRGFVLSLGIGYDFWVASELSLGVMGRFTYAPLTVTAVNGPDDRGVTVTFPIDAPALLLTATYQ